MSSSKVKEIRALALVLRKTVVAETVSPLVGSEVMDKGYLIPRKENCDRTWAQAVQKSENVCMIYVK